LPRAGRCARWTVLRLVGTPRPDGALLENEAGNPWFSQAAGRLDASGFPSGEC